MRFRKEGTNDFAEVCITAGGVQCTEYALPPLEGSPDYAINCCVLIEEGELTTVECHLDAYAVSGAIDLLVDGQFHNDLKFGPRGGAVKPWVKDHDFKTVFLRHNGSIACWPFSVSDLPSSGEDATEEDEFDPEEDCSLFCGEGSISVVVSLRYQKSDSMFPNGYPTMLDKSNEDYPYVRARQRPLDGLPNRTSQLYTYDPAWDQPSENRKKRFVAHGSHKAKAGSRWGTQPWVRFNFFYRNRESIEAAGLLPLQEFLSQPSLQPDQREGSRDGTPPVTTRVLRSATHAKQQQTEVSPPFLHDTVNIMKQEYAEGATTDSLFEIPPAGTVSVDDVSAPGHDIASDDSSQEGPDQQPPVHHVHHSRTKSPLPDQPAPKRAKYTIDEMQELILTQERLKAKEQRHDEAAERELDQLRQEVEDEERQMMEAMERQSQKLVDETAAIALRREVRALEIAEMKAKIEETKAKKARFGLSNDA